MPAEEEEVVKPTKAAQRKLEILSVLRMSL
jgi:hypothetical protein